MKVILTDEIHGLGTRGDVVTVKDGYARNFLLPKNLAREATASNLKSIEHERKKWALLAQKEKDEAQKAADSVKGTKIEVRKRIGDHGQLFGSVTTGDIAEALSAKGIKIDKRRIELEHAIKTAGVHDVAVRLHRDVIATIQLEVVGEGGQPYTPPPAAPKVESTDLPDEDTE